MVGGKGQGLLGRLSLDRCRDLHDLADTTYQAVGDAIPFGFACFATTDPATGLPTWSSKTRPLGCGDEEFAAVEYGGPDINTLAEIAERTPPVGALFAETGGRPETCRRYREFLSPRFGFSDELRVVFRSRGTTWGALALYREGEAPPFTAEEARQIGTLSEPLAEGVQRCLFSPNRSPGPVPAGLAVLITGEDGGVTHISPGAEAAIEELGGWDQGSLPTSVLAVAAVARTRPDPAETRAQGRSGSWLSLRAAPLNGPPGRSGDVVVTFEPTRRSDLSRMALTACGLTAREEDVAALVLQGASTQSIAASLYLSPHTVQDHLKAIFAKLGVSSRREMIAQLLVD